MKNCQRNNIKQNLHKININLNRNELLFGDVQMFDLFRLEIAFIEIPVVKREWVLTGWEERRKVK